MNDKYDVRFWQDNEYAVYTKDDYEAGYLIKGPIEEINAWLSLQSMGFDI